MDQIEVTTSARSRDEACWSTIEPLSLNIINISLLDKYYTTTTTSYSIFLLIFYISSTFI
jgi:hypothetical protein